MPKMVSGSGPGLRFMLCKLGYNNQWLARRCGLSPPTVSNALNGRKHYPHAMRVMFEAVREEIEKVPYQFPRFEKVAYHLTTYYPPGVQPRKELEVNILGDIRCLYHYTATKHALSISDIAVEAGISKAHLEKLLQRPRSCTENQRQKIEDALMRIDSRNPAGCYPVHNGEPRFIVRRQSRFYDNSLRRQNIGGKQNGKKI